MFANFFCRTVIDTPTGLQQFVFWNIVRQLHVGGRDKLAALRRADFIFTEDHLGNRFMRLVRFGVLIILRWGEAYSFNPSRALFLLEFYFG
jgi:hypothetical protein